MKRKTTEKQKKQKMISQMRERERENALREGDEGGIETIREEEGVEMSGQEEEEGRKDQKKKKHLPFWAVVFLFLVAMTHRGSFRVGLATIGAQARWASGVRGRRRRV